MLNKEVIILSLFIITIIQCKQLEILNAVAHPYHVSVENSGKHICSGAIIGPKVAVTTASCLYNLEVSNVQVRAGSEQFLAGGVVKNARKIMLHKKYLQRRKDYDIALIILASQFSFTNTIQAIDLPTNISEVPHEKTRAVLSSWALEESGFSHDLKSEQMQISVNINCKNAYAKYFIYITDRMFCAELLHKHPCKGDSGSPLVLDNVLIGISVWEQKCGDRNYPGIYTNIANLKRWIKMQDLE